MPSIGEELARLAKLRDSGSISDEEYETIKKSLLAETSSDQLKESEPSESLKRLKNVPLWPLLVGVAVGIVFFGILIVRSMSGVAEQTTTVIPATTIAPATTELPPTTTTVAPTTTTLPPEEWLLITKNEQLMMVREDGSDELLIGRGWGGKWSPNGWLVAFTTDDTDVAIYDLKDGTTLTLKTDAQFGDWSSDGKSVVVSDMAEEYYREDWGTWVQNVEGISIVDVETGVSTTVTNGVGNWHSYPQFVLDDERIVFNWANSWDSGEMYVVDVDGSNLGSLGSDSGGSNLAVSPDGLLVAFITDEGLEVLFGSIRQVLVSGDVGNPAWSPDGESIVFAYTDSLSYAMGIVDISTGQVSSADQWGLPSDWALLYR